MNNIQELIERLIITLETSVHGSLTYLVGNSIARRRTLNLLMQRLGDKRKLMLDVSMSNANLLDFLEESSRESDKPIIFISGFDELKASKRVEILKILKFPSRKSSRFRNKHCAVD